MDEDGVTAGMELLSLEEEPLGRNRDNLRRIRKRKGAPKWVHKLSKMVETMAKNSAEEVPMGVIAQKIWDDIMELNKDGRRLLKDEAKNKRQREREKKGIQGPGREHSGRMAAPLKSRPTVELRAHGTGRNRTTPGHGR